MIQNEKVWEIGGKLGKESDSICTGYILSYKAKKAYFHFAKKNEEGNINREEKEYSFEEIANRFGTDLSTMVA